MNAKRKISIKENKTKITASTLMRLAGVSAMVAGLCFIFIGMFHPVNIASSVTTATWVNVHIFATALGVWLVVKGFNSSAIASLPATSRDLVAEPLVP